MIYLLYDLILYLSALFLVPYYLFRGLRYGKARHGVRERLGIYAQDFRQLLEGRKIIWVHAVSVGETRAAIPLLKALKKKLKRKGVIHNLFYYMKENTLLTNMVKEALEQYRWCASPNDHPILSPKISIRPQGIKLIKH